MRRAFTLIELLVVIAIIAILAAILFPVFAQAKEAAKKTAYISNMKQTGTSAQLYIADTDDTYPQGYVARGETGVWAYGVVHPVPANVITSPPWDTQIRIDMASCFFANAMQPYMKNYDLMAEPNGIQSTVNGGPGATPDTFRAGVKAAQMGVMMNGFFHTLNGSSVNNVAAAILFWNTQKVNINGRGMSSPALYCPGGAVAQLCRASSPRVAPPPRLVEPRPATTSFTTCRSRPGSSAARVSSAEQTRPRRLSLKVRPLIRTSCPSLVRNSILMQASALPRVLRCPSGCVTRLETTRRRSRPVATATGATSDPTGHKLADRPSLAVLFVMRRASLYIQV
jgi:prepilin-type N-terminal cleavage/methylation domain-containing protein